MPDDVHRRAVEAATRHLVSIWPQMAAETGAGVQWGVRPLRLTCDRCRRCVTKITLDNRPPGWEDVPMRNDPHSPTNLITEDYEFAYAYDSRDPFAGRAHARPVLDSLIADGWRFASIHGGESCDHCGARLRYVAVLKHLPTRSLVKVGETCLDNRFDLATAEFHRLRQQAKLNRERQALAEKRAEFLSVPRNAEAVAFLQSRYDAGDTGFAGFYFDLLHKANRYGGMTDRQVDAVHRAIERQAAYEARKAAEAALPTIPVIEGRIPITGEVLSVKWQDNDFGGREVMTVRDNRGFKVWGSTPSAVTVDKGDTITFVATVTKSDRDESFGFFKRPTKAEVLNVNET